MHTQRVAPCQSAEEEGTREERQLGFYLAFISFIYSHCEKLSGEARAVG